MSLDIIGILFVVFYFIRGYSKGLIVSVFSMLSLLLGIVVAMSLSHPFSEWMISKDLLAPGRARLVAYIVLFVVVVVLVRVLANILQHTAKSLMLGGVNMFLGGFFYAFLGAVLWSIILWIGVRVHFISQSNIAASKTYGMVSNLAPWFFNSASKVLPFAADAYSNFDNFLRKW